MSVVIYFFFFQAEDGIRDVAVTGVQTCALPICGGASGGNFFKFHTGVPNSQNAEALQQDFAFGYDVDLLSIAKKGEARSAVGHSAKTIELHTARQGQRRRGRGWRWKLGTWNFAFLVGTRDTRRRSLYRAKRIAAGTLVFRLAGTCDLIHANLRIVDAEHGVVVLDGGICNNCARLAVEIP